MNCKLNDCTIFGHPRLFINRIREQFYVQFLERLIVQFFALLDILLLQFYMHNYWNGTQYPVTIIAMLHNCTISYDPLMIIFFTTSLFYFIFYICTYVSNFCQTGHHNIDS